MSQNNIKSIFTELAPAPIGPYSQAIQAGPFLYLSGQIALNPSTGELMQSSLEEEVQQIMSNIKNLLDKAGYSFENVVKSSIFLSSMELFAQVNSIYEQYFHAPYPARETVAVAGLPKNVNVEISIIAWKNDQ